MATWAWVVVAAAVLIIVVAAGWALVTRNRTKTLRRNFGPEYDRALAKSDGRRQAENELRQREVQRAELNIRPLPAADQLRYLQEWQAIQARFVDEPTNAVTDADGLLAVVMRARGYPVDDFENQADLVSVDHPVVVDNYRLAHGVYERSSQNLASTEELRDSLLRYRSLFAELLQDQPDQRATATQADFAGRGATAAPQRNGGIPSSQADFAGPSAPAPTRPVAS